MKQKNNRKIYSLILGLAFLLQIQPVQADIFQYTTSTGENNYLNSALEAINRVILTENNIEVEVKSNPEHAIISVIADEPTTNNTEISEITNNEKKVETIEDIKEYVRNEAKKAGLNSKEVEAIINCESRWDPQAKGHNKNGSYDLGLWQINSIHKNITDAEKLDYKTATKWAIEKRLRDGNWSAWYCARRLAIK